MNPNVDRSWQARAEKPEPPPTQLFRRQMGPIWNTAWGVFWGVAIFAIAAALVFVLLNH